MPQDTLTPMEPAGYPFRGTANLVDPIDTEQAPKQYDYVDAPARKPRDDIQFRIERRATAILSTEAVETLVRDFILKNVKEANGLKAQDIEVTVDVDSTVVTFVLP